MLLSLRSIIGVITAHVDHKGIMGGLWKGKIEVHWPESKGRRSVGLIGEEVRRMHRQETLLEVEHFKAHRSKTEKQELSLFERSVTEGNERADESAKDGHCVMEEKWRRSEPAQFSRKERRSIRLFSVQLNFIVWWRSDTMVKNSSRSQNKSWFLWKKGRS